MLYSEFIITTTGTSPTISFPDIGSRLFTHPVTVDLVSTEGYKLHELLFSKDICDAIDAGYITVQDSEGNPISSSADLKTVYQPHVLGAHDDVDFSAGVSDGEVLEYESASGKWKAGAGGGGLSPTTHRNLDQLVHELAEDAYVEFLYSGNLVTDEIYWTNNLKVAKIREYNYSYTANKVNTEVIKQYDVTGLIVVETLTRTYNYTGNKVTSIDEVLT